MKHLIKRVRKFLIPNPKMNVNYLQEKIRRLENDLSMFNYNWYELHIEKGEDTSTLNMLKEQAQFHVAHHIELLSRARILRLKKRLIAFVIVMNVLLLIYLIL